MKLTFLPIRTVANKGINNNRFSSGFENTHMFLHRKDEPLKRIMKRVSVNNTEDSNNENSLWISGQFDGDFNFSDLKDGDILTYEGSMRNKAITGTFYVSDDCLMPFDHEPTSSSIASGLLKLKHNDYIIVTGEKKISDIVSKALQMKETSKELNQHFPIYRNIMIKNGDEVETRSITELISMQNDEIRPKLETSFLSMPSSTNNFNKASQKLPFIKQILFDIEEVSGFSLMTEEEQVGQFIEFSRKISSNKEEHVTDEMIENIKESNEYKKTLKQIEDCGFKHSKTQQFNVLQQVGYMSRDRDPFDNILYNLSDMGAGKTLMTVQAIAMLDAKQLASWEPREGQDIDEMSLRLPDKHIIAPTLSIRSSWIETFKIFYDVEKVNDSTYNLTTTHNGRQATSTIYASAFTIKNSMSYVDEKLPVAEDGTYLIIDELHQLAKRTIARTKFFPPGTKPDEIYRTFVLSGTLSNLLTQEWLNYMKFMGISVSGRTPQEAAAYTESRKRELVSSIDNAIINIRTNHQRRVDADPFTKDNIYLSKEPKMSGIDKEFYADYGSQLLNTENILYEEDDEFDFKDLIENTLSKRDYALYVNPDDSDTTNFKLFYELVGSQSITAESSVVAEELFGKEQKAHTSDIIKTASPLNNEDIEILRTLHHIAEDHSKYKSLSIAKSIHTAVLNLNDGLQKKNVYDIISQAADRNLRFFEYLTTLELDVLEKLPQSNLIDMPKLEDTEKFAVLEDILKKEEDETHLIVVNDYYAMKTLSEKIGVEPITKAQLKDELGYQDTLNELFDKQSIVVVTQDMIKSSLDLIQANRLVQYQLNSEISDIIQTQNRINRIGQTKETKGYYIATDVLQENLIELFLDSYKNIRVAHKGIVELFVDVTSQINIVNDYLSKAFSNIEIEEDIDSGNGPNGGGGNFLDKPHNIETEKSEEKSNPTTKDILDQVNEENEIIHDIANIAKLPEGKEFRQENNLSQVILIPQDGQVVVIVPLRDDSPFTLGTLTKEKVKEYNVTEKVLGTINLETMKVAV